MQILSRPVGLIRLAPESITPWMAFMTTQRNATSLCYNEISYWRDTFPCTSSHIYLYRLTVVCEIQERSGSDSIHVIDCLSICFKLF